MTQTSFRNLEPEAWPQSPAPSNLQTGQASARTLLQNLAALFGLLLLLPFNLSLVGLALIRAGLKRFQPVLSVKLAAEPAAEPTAEPAVSRTILISGGKMTKALHLARCFHRAGHRVILVETHKYWLIGHRFSSAVDRFYTVSNPESASYASDLLAIVQAENVDLYVPVCSPIASYYDALAGQLLERHCEILHTDAATLRLLDDKYQFAKAAQGLGLAVPRSFYITEPQQVLDFDFSAERRSYILKSIAYDSVRRLNLTRLPGATPEATAAFVRSLPISPANPWIMQEFISGQEFCTHSTVRAGELRVYCCCKSSAFQVNYAAVEQPQIKDWVTRFVAGLNLTGQFSFDLIQAEDDGQIYAIECNPRTHSAVTLFDHAADLARAYLSGQSLTHPVEPLPAVRPTYWTYHELWRLVTHLHRPSLALDRLKVLRQGRDAVFDWDDPLPFLMLHHWQIPLLLLQALRRQRSWIRIDFNIGKLVQLGGD